MDMIEKLCVYKQQTLYICRMVQIIRMWNTIVINIIVGRTRYIKAKYVIDKDIEK